MRICGIIAEYNPFHNGHKIHVDKTRQKTGSDFIICVMSPNFVQRGEPAVFDKWTRAQCALLGGADAVIELPFLNAVQSAEGFALGGVKTLLAAGSDMISFGSETENIDSLCSIADTFSKEKRSFKRALKSNLSKGMSFPSARMKAAFPDAREELSMPNAILAIEYIKAINKTKANIEPVCIKRVGQSYHSEDISTNLSSATAIRNALKEGRQNEAFASIPEACISFLNEQLDLGLKPVFPPCFDKELIFRLRQGGPEYIKTLHDVSEGLENRIYEAAKTSTTRHELIEKIKTKRYTYTRISRILLYALFGITRTMIEKHNKKAPQFLHVLGAKNKEVLSILSKTAKVPLVTGKSELYSHIDLAATDVYALSQDTEPFYSSSRDFIQKLIVLE